MSDWKERANARRDFRSGKFEPEVPKHRKRRPNKKPWKIVVYGCTIFGRKDWIIGRYKTEQGAKDAMASYKQNYWKNYQMRIEKDD